MSITVYLKITNYCNVGCDFCYLPESARKDKSVMSNADAATIALRAERLAEQYGYKSVHYIIHGGEPLTLSPSRLDDVLSTISAASTIQVSFSLQTSLVPYRNTYAPFVHKWMDGRVGTSIDFRGRTVSGSNLRYQKLWLQKVEEARNDNIMLTPIHVPSRSDIGRESEIVRFFLENNFDDFSIERYNSYGDSLPSPSRPRNIEHSNILIGFATAIFDEFKKGRVIGNNVILSALRGISEGLSGDRWGTNCIKNFMVVTPGGEVDYCPDRVEFSPELGRINEPELIARQGRIKLLSEYQHGHSNSYCVSCENYSWCRTGCPITDNNVAKEGDCSGYRHFLTWLRSYDRHVRDEYRHTVAISRV